jgi:phosphohistidine phosphatase
MQRTLVMIRHAKSSWNSLTQSDFDRPLNERGENDAPIMGKRLKELGLQPDLIIASAAKRAKQTAKKIAEGIGYNKNDIQWEEKLYHCTPPVFEEVIYSINDAMKTVFIVAHNPGITTFVNQLSSAFSIDNMPTCGVVATHLDAAHWNEFNKAKKEVFLFEYSKK